MEKKESEAMKSRTTVERKGERELVITRIVNGPARIVYEAWTKPELLQQWWAPKSTGMVLTSCELDVRVGGKYRLVFSLEGGKSLAFFGKYLEVIPGSRLVWTNEEGDQSVTTATFEEQDGKTLLVLSEVYPSKEARDENVAGMDGGMRETLQQLEALVAILAREHGNAEANA